MEVSRRVSTARVEVPRFFGSANFPKPTSFSELVTWLGLYFSAALPEDFVINACEYNCIDHVIKRHSRSTPNIRKSEMHNQSKNSMDIDTMDVKLSDSAASEALASRGKVTEGIDMRMEFSTISSHLDRTNESMQPDVHNRTSSNSLPRSDVLQTVSSMYDPERRINAETSRTPPKRFHRTVWRSLAVRIMNK